MDKKQFDQLPIEHKIHIIDKYLGLYQGAVTDRMAVLPTASGIAAMLLVVATFNEKLLQIDCLMKILLSLLLVIIPISLLVYNIDTVDAQKQNKLYLDKLTGNNEKDDLGYKNKIISYFPEVIIFLISFVVIIFIYKIWFK